MRQKTSMNELIERNANDGCIETLLSSFITFILYTIRDSSILLGILEERQRANES